MILKNSVRVHLKADYAFFVLFLFEDNGYRNSTDSALATEFVYVVPIPLRKVNVHEIYN